MAALRNESTRAHRDFIMQLLGEIMQDSNRDRKEFLLGGFGEVWAEYLLESAHGRWEGFTKAQVRAIQELLADFSRYCSAQAAYMRSNGELN